MSPFAENTGNLFAEAAKVARPFRFSHLKEYVSTPEFANFRARSLPILVGMRGVVLYSNQVVGLNNAQMSDKERNDLLARYLTEVLDRVADKRALDSIGVTQTMRTEVFTSIRSAETYLDGIAACSPIVDAVVLAIGNQLESLRAEMPGITAMVDRQIEKEFSATRSNLRSLTDLQQRSMRAAALLYNGRMGNQASLDSLLQGDASIREMIPRTDQATPKALDSAEKYLAERLTRLDTYIHQLDPELERYRAKQQELEDLRVNIDERIKVARTAMMIWSQSHRSLGAGVPVPPLIDVAGMASGLVRTAVPIP